MNVTKVITTMDYPLFDRLVFKDTVFNISSPYRVYPSTVDYSDVFDTEGRKVGQIKGYFFDFANKALFKRLNK